MLETHVFQQQKQAKKYLEKYNCQIESWGPFAEGKNDFFNTPLLKGIGEKHGKTVAQVALRFLLQSDVIVIPKSVRKERMQENFDIFDFELTDDEMKSIEGLDQASTLFHDHPEPETAERFISFLD